MISKWYMYKDIYNWDNWCRQTTGKYGILGHFKNDVIPKEFCKFEKKHGLDYHHLLFLHIKF